MSVKCNQSAVYKEKILLHLEDTHVPWEDIFSGRVPDQHSYETWQLTLLELELQHLQQSFHHQPVVLWFGHQVYLLL